MLTTCATANALLACWFEDGLESPAGARRLIDRCFSHNPEFDRALTTRFGSLPARVAAGEFEHWREQPETALAALIALDQLPRNLYRGRAQAYAFDQLALELAHYAHAAGYPEQLHPLAGAFFNLPLEHAEDLALQERSVAGYLKQHARADADFAPLLHEWVIAGRDHLEVIARFGRFPHRNAIIGRESTLEEREWLTSGGKHWGQVAVSDATANDPAGL